MADQSGPFQAQTLPGTSIMDTLSQFLAQRQAERQQQLVNDAAAQREADQHQVQMENLKQLQELRAAQTEQKQQAVSQAVQSSLTPGQSIDPATLAALGPSAGALTPAVPAGPPLPMGAPGVVAATPTGDPSIPSAPMTLPGQTPIASTPAMGPGVIYKGNPGQLAAAKQKSDLKDFASNIYTMDAPTIMAEGTRLGIDPKILEGVVASIKGPKDSPITPEAAYEAIGADGKPLNGVVGIQNGIGLLNGQPLPDGAHIRRVPAPPPAVIKIDTGLKTDNTTGATTANAAITGMANYEIKLPTFRMNTPQGVAAFYETMNAIKAVNPEYDATRYDERAKTRRDFATGTQGRQLQNIDAATQHLEQMRGALTELGNGDFTPGNAGYQYFSKLFGSSTPTNADTVREYVATELAKANTGGVPDMNTLNTERALLSRTSSPAQFTGAIDQTEHVLQARVKKFDYEYSQSMGARAPRSGQLISPESQAILDKASGGGGNTSPVTKVFSSGPYAGKTGTKQPDGSWKIQQ